MQTVADPCSANESNEATVGATLVKARGKDRTAVPEHVMRLYNVFMHTTQGAALEGDKCFICQSYCDAVCSLCCLWSHADCCESLAYNVAGCGSRCADDHGEECENEEVGANISEALLKAYRESCDDRTCDFLAAVNVFDAHSRNSQGSSRCALEVAESACPLCCYVLDLGPGNIDC